MGKLDNERIRPHNSPNECTKNTDCWKDPHEILIYGKKLGFSDYFPEYLFTQNTVCEDSSPYERGKLDLLLMGSTWGLTVW